MYLGTRGKKFVKVQTSSTFILLEKQGLVVSMSGDWQFRDSIK